MNRRFAFSLAMLVAGTSLIAAAAFADPASSSGQARGGTLRYEIRSDFDHIDPAYAYFSHTWQMQNATHLKLYTFPDQGTGEAAKRIIPDGAAGMPRISRDGKTYTIQVKPGFRFSNGQPVTAANYVHAFNRIVNVKPPSDAVPFLTEVVGGQAAARNGGRIAGVTAKGNTITIRLTRVTPDLTARLTMPFFSAQPLSHPLDKEVTQAPVHSAGPYYLRAHENNRSAEVVRNPNYRGTRRGFVDRIAYTFGNSLAAQRLKVERGEADVGSFPPAEAAELAQRYGINKGRFFMTPTSTTWYLAFNHDRPVFGGSPNGNVRLKQAVNYAIDRPQIARQYGYLGGRRTDQILPPTMIGWKNWNIYPIRGADPRRGTQLAQGNTRGGKAVLYTFDTAPGPQVAQVVQFNLKQIGVDVEIRTFERTVQHEKLATKGEPFDIGYEGWGQDYPDPYNFINVLLDGRRIQAANNQNVSYFNSPEYIRRMERASRLSGQPRYAEYGRLDRDLMKNVAPWAPLVNQTRQNFVSTNVIRFGYHPVQGTANLMGIELRG